MDEIEKKLLGIHEKRKTLEAIEAETIEELGKCQQKLSEMRNSLVELNSLIAETIAINTQFIELTGEDDEQTREMIAGAEKHLQILSEKISGYENLQTNLNESLRKSIELQAELAVMRSTVN